MTQDASAPRPRARWGGRVVLGVTILFVVAGIASIWRAEYLESNFSFGWVAYAPLSDTTFTPSDAPQLGLEWGIGLLAAGFVALAVLLGRAWRRRHPAARVGVDVALGVAAFAVIVVGSGCITGRPRTSSSAGAR